jgi:hypothetical protein
MQTHGVDAGDEQTGSWHSAVQHLERQIAVLVAETEALHNATCQVLQCSRGEARLQVFIAAVQPANGYYNTGDHSQHTSSKEHSTKDIFKAKAPIIKFTFTIKYYQTDIVAVGKWTARNNGELIYGEGINRN